MRNGRNGRLEGRVMVMRRACHRGVLSNLVSVEHYSRRLGLSPHPVAAILETACAGTGCTVEGGTVPGRKALRLRSVGVTANLADGPVSGEGEETLDIGMHTQGNFMHHKSTDQGKSTW